MDPVYCWQFKECTRECDVRKEGTLFCWRSGIEDCQSREGCDGCGYREKWVRGEFSVDRFFSRSDRRSAPRTATKVLVIDDDPNTLYALEETVRYLGHDCVAACDGEEGYLLARNIRPDLIVTDILMPKMDGLELCATLRRDRRTTTIPLMVVTARNRKEDKEKSADLGVEAFLVKPFRCVDLTEHISRIIARRERRDGIRAFGATGAMA